jgi:hypothetical protein
VQHGSAGVQRQPSLEGLEGLGVVEVVGQQQALVKQRLRGWHRGVDGVAEAAQVKV